MDHSGGDEVDGTDTKCNDAGASGRRSLLTVDLIRSRSPEKLYCDVMQPLQFGKRPESLVSPQFFVSCLLIF